MDSSFPVKNEVLVVKRVILFGNCLGSIFHETLTDNFSSRLFSQCKGSHVRHPLIALNYLMSPVRPTDSPLILTRVRDWQVGTTMGKWPTSQVSTALHPIPRFHYADVPPAPIIGFPWAASIPTSRLLCCRRYGCSIAIRYADDYWFKEVSSGMVTA